MIIHAEIRSAFLGAKVTALLQKYLETCHATTGRKVLWLDGLLARKEMRAELKRTGTPAELIITFSRANGSPLTEKVKINQKGKVEASVILGEERVFTLEGLPESTEPDLGFLGEFLRMEVSLQAS